MKAIILAGGLGSRITEETFLKPKPMIEIGNKPLLWHIMKSYSYYNINDFIICLGYKGYLIKEYFANYFMHMSDVTIDIQKNKVDVHQNFSEPWTITLVDTGEHTMTGGRIKRVSKFIDDTFCLTYGDGLSDLNISDTIKFHKKNQLTATLTAVQRPGRFGALKLDDINVTKFQEKSSGDLSWVNGGFFVFEPNILDFIKDDSTVLELDPLTNLAEKKQLGAYRHNGFWQPMDTLREKILLENLWSSGKPPWKTW